MNIFDKMDKDWETMQNAFKGVKKTTEPDGVETELVEGAVDRDGTYEQAYDDYASEEMKTILGNRFN